MVIINFKRDTEYFNRHFGARLLKRFFLIPQNSKIVIICLFFIAIDAKPIEKDNSKKLTVRHQKNVQYKALGQNWMDPYKRINISAKINSRNEEKRKQDLTRSTRSTTKVTTTTPTNNPLCMPQIVKLEAPLNQAFYPPFTSKDWSPGMGK